MTIHPLVRVQENTVISFQIPYDSCRKQVSFCCTKSISHIGTVLFFFQKCNPICHMEKSVVLTCLPGKEQRETTLKKSQEIKMHIKHQLESPPAL